jgi:hypothetical protein
MTTPVSLFRSRSSPWLVVGVLAGLMAWLPACRAVDLQGHRGARGPRKHTGAFERALEIGISTLELDLAITADSVAVVCMSRRCSETTPVMPKRLSARPLTDR